MPYVYINTTTGSQDSVAQWFELTLTAPKQGTTKRDWSPSKPILRREAHT